MTATEQPDQVRPATPARREDWLDATVLDLMARGTWAPQSIVAAANLLDEPARKLYGWNIGPRDIWCCYKRLQASGKVVKRGRSLVLAESATTGDRRINIKLSAITAKHFDDLSAAHGGIDPTEVVRRAVAVMALLEAAQNPGDGKPPRELFIRDTQTGETMSLVLVW